MLSYYIFNVRQIVVSPAGHTMRNQLLHPGCGQLLAGRGSPLGFQPLQSPRRSVASPHDDSMSFYKYGLRHCICIGTDFCTRVRFAQVIFPITQVSHTSRRTPISAPSIYTLGEVLNITVSFSNSNTAKHGFELSALDANSILPVHSLMLIVILQKDPFHCLPYSLL